MAGIDTLLGAAVDSVKRSGALEAGALSAVVTAVASDGTLTVTHGQDTYPRVRLLSGYSNPTVGATVQILKTAGGWVCLGAQVTANPSTWTPIPLAANWAAYNTATYYEPGYRTTSDGMVQFCGVAKPVSGAVTGTLTLATMPAALRPTRKVRFSCEVSFTSGAGVFGVIDINTNGTVQIADFPGSATFAMLDIVQYRLS